MRKLTGLLAGALGLATLAAFALVVVLLFGGLSRREAAPTVTPPLTPTRPATPTVVPTRITPPPLQTPTQPASPLPTPTVPGSGLEDYIFGPPQVILTHTTAMGLVGWLPDSERLLVTRRVPTDTVREYIETINVRTGEIQHYAERHSSSAKPVWLPTPQAVAYGDIDLVEKEIKLRISAGLSGQGRQIGGLWSPNIAADSDGRRVVFFLKGAEKRPYFFHVSQAITQPLPFNLAALERPDEEEAARGRATAYNIAWHPSQPKVAFYNNYHLFLASLDTGQVQEIDLGRRSTGEILWTFYARWSPDGRYLALLTTAGIPPVHFVDLAILDTTTGTLRRIDLNLRFPYVSEVAWAPNSRHLAIWAVITMQEGTDWAGLYLVDAVTAGMRRMMPETLFGSNNATWTWNMDWSPNGNTIAVACPGAGQPRWCLIPVTVRQ